MSDNETDAESMRSSHSTRAATTARAPPKSRHRSRQRDESQSENASLGRALARLRQMYGCAKDPVSKAFEFPIGKSRADKEAHRQNLELYEWMLQRSPGLESQLNVETRDVWRLVKTIGREIDEGRNEARSSDTAALKRGVAADFDILDDEDEFGKWTPGLSIKRRSESWGYNHPQLAVLLTPIGMDWENDRDRQKLLSAGGIVDYRCWYPFMYEGRVADETNLAKGLLRGDLLVKATNYVLNRRLDAQQGNRNVATILGVTHVTIELIAYIATLLRFVLSSEARIDGGFDSDAFYNHIVNSMHEMDPRWIKDLLRWWDNQIFPEQHRSRSTIFPGDTFASIKRQAQRAESNEHPESPGDVDGVEIRSAAPQQDRQETSISKKRDLTAAGLESERRVLSEEPRSNDENDQSRPAKSAKSAKVVRLRVPDPDEQDEEGDEVRSSEEERDREREQEREREREREREQERKRERKERERKKKGEEPSTRRKPHRDVRSSSAPRGSPSADRSSEPARPALPHVTRSTSSKNQNKQKASTSRT